MIGRTANARWLGWCGTIVFLATSILIARITAFSFFLWIEMMLLASALCFYGGMRRSKWFLLPACLALTHGSGVVFASMIELQDRG